jgi:hypothetical protein
MSRKIREFSREFKLEIFDPPTLGPFYLFRLFLVSLVRRAEGRGIKSGSTNGQPQSSQGARYRTISRSLLCQVRVRN